MLLRQFAETFHWILKNKLQRQGLPAKIVHYLDDFLILLPPATTTALSTHSTRFHELCQEVGLFIKVSKNEERTITSFVGIEMDRDNTVIRLQERRVQKAQQFIENVIDETSLSLLELQMITGYLNFVATVVPLCCTFLRPLYNMPLYFLTQQSYYCRPISGEAQRDLTMWQKVLVMAPERSIRKE